VSSEIDGFNPWINHFDATGLTYANTVFDSLTRVTRNGGWVPYLAQSVVPNPDRTAWTVTLRPNVVFHDGSPLNADVAIANFQKLRTSLLTGQTVTTVSAVTKTGELSYVVSLKQPVAAFPYSMATQLGYVAAQSQIDNPSGSQHPVGTGPFIAVDWSPNDHFTVKANPHYWRSGLPYLDGITFKPIVQDASRENSLQSATIDMMVSHDPHAIKDLAHNSTYSQVDTLGSTVGEPDMQFIILNTSIAPLDDINVRRALAYALDTNTLNRLFGAGVTEPATSPFSQGSPYRSPDNHYPTYNLAKARELVAQAKPNHGGTLLVNLATVPDPRLLAVLQAIQQMWQQAGFTVTLSTYQQATFIDNMLSGTSFMAYTDEMFAAPDPDLNYVWWSPTTVPPPVTLNWSRLKDPRIETALQQGRTESNPQLRAQAYQTLDNLLAEDLPYLWLGQSPWSLTAKTSVANYNNPIAPDGTPLQGFNAGIFDPTPMWVQT